MLISAMEPGWMAPVLDAAGLHSRTARIATARISVVLVFFGAGLICIGLAWLAWVARHRALRELAVELLQPVAHHLGATMEPTSDGALRLRGELGGLRTEIQADLTRKGFLWVVARDATGMPIGVTALGEPSTNIPPTWSSTMQGPNFSIWQPGDAVASAWGLEAEQALTQLFGAAGGVSVHQDFNGIEIQLDHDPMDDWVARLQVGLDVLLVVSRASG